jgi:hypothetical protein
MEQIHHQHQQRMLMQSNATNGTARGMDTAVASMVEMSSTPTMQTVRKMRAFIL